MRIAEILKPACKACKRPIPILKFTMAMRSGLVPMCTDCIKIKREK